MAEKTQMSVMANLKRFFALVKPYQGQFYLLLFVALVLQGLVVAERYIFKVLIDDGTLFSAGELARDAFLHTIIILVLIFLGMIVVRVICKHIHMTLINRIDAALIRDIKRKFFNHIVGLSHSFHTTHKTGSMISRLTRGGRAVESMMDAIIFNAAPITFQLAVAAVALFALSWVSAVVILATVVVFVAYSVLIQQRQLPAKQAANDQEDAEKAVMSDIILNIESVKYFGKEEPTRKRFGDITETTRQAMVRHWDYYRTLDVGHVIILGIGTGLLIGLALKSYLDGAITLGTLVFIYTVYLSLMSPMHSLVHGIRSFYQSTADFDSIYQYDAIRNEIDDKEHAPRLQITHGVIDFKGVAFKYQNRPLFEDFTLHIDKHQKVALVGHSGSGKTTLVKLLYRLYDVEAGAITIDGHDLRDVKQESLRSELSIVPQECVLFDDTIYNNIAFSNPGASREQVLQAIRFAQLDKTIENFPNKEETIVGERGVKLSGGEKQRVSIARAILADKRILVLDEATSALDSQTEAEIQADLAKLMKGRTTIIIAHRLSTIMSADKIVVLDHGKIVQVGTHKQLIKRKGQYRKLWELQKGGYIK